MKKGQYAMTRCVDQRTENLPDDEIAATQVPLHGMDFGVGNSSQLVLGGLFPFYFLCVQSQDMNQLMRE